MNIILEKPSCQRGEGKDFREQWSLEPYYKEDVFTLTQQE